MKVIVTGLPRSGTSFLAGLITRMGFSLGDSANIKEADQYNRYGYFEHLRLMELSNSILRKLGGDYFLNIPDVRPGWTMSMKAEKALIQRYVNEEGIELYKDNRLVLLSDIYKELYPDAKWVYIERAHEETYRSRFGRPLSMNQWLSMSEARLDGWNRSKVKDEALAVRYLDFVEDFDRTVADLACFLGVTHVDMSMMKEWFMPSGRK
jgi:hypothetical protein